MKVKNAKQSGRSSTFMFYAEALELINDLENIQKARNDK